MTDILTFVPEEPPGDRRLEPFKEINARKAPWEERVEVIREQFPSVSQLDWGKLFQKDPVILGRIINDIIKKTEAEEPSRPGKRPNLDEQSTTAALARLQDEDHTMSPFHIAFGFLKGERSVRAVANKVGMSSARTHRLLTGDTKPIASDMENIARAFKKDPSYFYEYRVAYIVSIISYRLERYKESSVIHYNEIKRMTEKAV